MEQFQPEIPPSVIFYSTLLLTLRLWIFLLITNQPVFSCTISMWDRVAPRAN